MVERKDLQTSGETRMVPVTLDIFEPRGLQCSVGRNTGAGFASFSRPLAIELDIETPALAKKIVRLLEI
jgi:hypothetical protein